MKLCFIFECIDIMRNLKVDTGRLESLCREYHVKRLAVFGSVLNGHDKPGSDLDLLVEFQAGKTPGLAYFHLQDKLSHLFGQTVDLNTPAFLSRYFRDEVVRTAQNVYVDQ
jgi:predicted nucleotidyltransferase